MKKLTIFFLFVSLFTTSFVHAQIVVTPNQTANTLATTIVGPGVTVTNATLNCPGNANGVFSNGNASMLGINSGVLLTSGSAINALAPNNAGATGTNNNAPGDADLSALIGNTVTRDRCVLEFDFEAIANQISISFVFGSEEYLEYINSAFNDVFGFLVSGPNPAGGTYNKFNIATIPVNIPVAINTINPGSNSSYFVNNPQGGSPLKIEYDGYTVVITASLDIVPCVQYHFKLGIADATDFILDSGVFLEEASFQASIECQDFTLTLSEDGTGSITVDDILTRGVGECDFDFDLSQSDFVCSDEGENVVTITATDDNGNELTCEATVTVVVPEGIIGVGVDGECVTVYPGYEPAACTTLTADASGGTTPYTYEWSNSASTESINVCPGTTTTYVVTVTDANGCSGEGSVTVIAINVSCGNNDDKVEICHIPPGNPENANTLCVSANSVPAHLAHGDFLGSCEVTADPCGTEFAGSQIQERHDYDLAEPSISPNPGSTEIAITLPDYVSGTVTVELNSLEGKTVRSIRMKEGHYHDVMKNLSSLADGVYILRITDETGDGWNIKWVKN